MASDNVDVIESAWAAFRKGDLDGALVSIAPEAQIRIPENLPFGGVYVGPEGLRDYATKFAASVPNAKPVPEKVLGADDDHVIVVLATTGPGKEGERFEHRSAWIYRLRDGAIVEAELFTDTAAFNEVAS